MLPLSAPSALKPSLVGVGVAACAPPSSCGTAPRPHRPRNSLCSRRVSLDVSRLSLDGRRTSSCWANAGALSPPLAALSSSPSAHELLLEPFGLPWTFASAADLTIHAEHDGTSDSSVAPTPTRSRRSSVDSQLPTAPQQVTRHNFHLALPLVAKALEECTFFALDCEFTGLSPQAPHFSELYDDAADRYQRVLSSSQQFSVMQLGLSMFVRDEVTGAYTSRTFNFSVFPKPSGPNDRRFLCQASSLEFLASQGFDFNRWVYDGIPYLQLSQRDRNLQDLAMTGMAAPAPATAALSDFALTGGFSQVLELIRSSGKPVVLHNGLADMVYTLQQFACPLPDSWDDFKPLAASWFTGGVYDTRVLAGQVMAEAQLPGLFADLTLSQVNNALAPGGAVEAALCTAAAAASVQDPTRPLLDSLPAVVHAPGYALYPDGAQGSASGASSDTASSGTAYGVAAVEPACLMGTSPASSFVGSSSSPFAAVEGNSSTGSTSGSTSASFSGRSSSAPIHEAGYDAYLTGAVFARLARAAQLLLPHMACTDSVATGNQEQDCSSCSSSEIVGPVTPCPGSPHSANAAAASSRSGGSVSTSEPAASPLSALSAWRGRLHSMRADVPYLHLYGADPLPVRPHVFYISSLPLHTKVSTVASKFSEAGLGKVRVVMLGPAGDAAYTGTSTAAAATARSTGQVQTAAASSKSAFVQLTQPELADAVLPAVKTMGVPWKVIPYAEYHAAKLRGGHAPSSVGASGSAAIQPVTQQQQPQPKYRLVKVPEEEQQQLQAARGRAAGSSNGNKGATGCTADSKQQGARQRPVLTATASSEGAAAGAAAAPKRYITVMRKIATSVLTAPQQQQQQQQQPVHKQQHSKQMEGGEAGLAVPSRLLVAPPPPPPPRTPYQVLAPAAVASA